ncbi:MAG: hypothetical protein JWO87_81 [Phycisphaerales bacterium]|jgi:hypothetical protein|nr:hypothetical protein [Phycisphaerales bacterium]MDB5298418.1 hypothetical protein [Phycisphaerales bacterium]MDB5303264.1 hypothetical protein [Phycisphaerales bacterium]
MSVIRIGDKGRILAGAALAGVLLAGCAKQAPTIVPPPPKPNPQPAATSDVAVRVRELGREAEALAGDSGQLPGQGDDHRRLMHRVFDDLARVLPLLHGPQPDGVFKNRMVSIENSRALLSNSPQGLSIEPAIDTGLGAAQAALADIARTSYYEQADLGPLLDKLSAKINGLDLVRGPLHQVDAASAVDLTSQIVSKMAAVLAERVSSQSPPTTAPATAPAAGR